MSVFLFADGSVTPQLGVGFGAFFLSFADGLEFEDLEDLRDLIKIRRFENTSSNVLELQTLLWALSETSEREVVSYTDSQNLNSLTPKIVSKTELRGLNIGSGFLGAKVFTPVSILDAFLGRQRF